MNAARPSRPVAIAGASVALAAGVLAAGTVWLWAAMAAAGGISCALAWWADGAALAKSLRVRGRDVVVGAVSGAVMVALTYAVYPLFAARSQWLVTQVGMHYEALNAPPGPLLALPILLLVVVSEELVWRGLAVETLPADWSPARIVAASAFLYALPQLASASILLVALAVGCGVLWGAQRLYSGGLTVPLITHGIWSTTVFQLFPLDR